MFESKILKPKFWDKTGFNFLSLILLPFSIITILVNLLKKYKTKKNLVLKLFVLEIFMLVEQEKHS